MRYFTKTPHCRGVDNAGAVGFAFKAEDQHTLLLHL